MQEKRLIMIRDCEYIVLRAYTRELQLSRLMQETEDDPGEQTIIE